MPPKQQRYSRISPPEALAICKQFVYPPCGKLGGSIDPDDRIKEDLGYYGPAMVFLAARTNDAFQFHGDNSFSSLDLSLLETVQDHVAAICAKLNRLGRLIYHAQKNSPAAHL